MEEGWGFREELNGVKMGLSSELSLYKGSKGC